MASDENLRTLAGGGGHYVVALPCTRGGEVVTEVLSRPGRFREVRENLRVKEVWVGRGERRRRYVVCHNPREAGRQRAHREELLDDLESELEAMARRTADHPKRACELLSSRRYGRYLRALKDGRLRLNRAAIREAGRRDGLWVIRSNDESLSAEDLALAYKQLMRVEEAWKTMKSGLEIRPVFHRTPERIRAHIFLCVLALSIERIIETACGRPWARIREELRKIKVAQLLTPNGTLYQRSPMSREAGKLFKQLKVTPPSEIIEAR